MRSASYDEDYYEEPASIEKIGWYVHDPCRSAVFFSDPKLSKDRYCKICDSNDVNWKREPGYDFRDESYRTHVSAAIDRVMRRLIVDQRMAVAASKQVLAEVVPILRSGIAWEAFQFMLERDRELAIAYYEEMTRAHPEAGS